MSTTTASRRDVFPQSEAELAAFDAQLEAVLMSVSRPVPAGALAVALLYPGQSSQSEDPDTEPKASPEMLGHVSASVERLNAEYDRTGRSFRIEPVAGGLRIMTRPQFASSVAAFQKSRANTKLTRAAIETLAIIAYKQPMTRAELEAIRGVACGEVLRTLLDRRMVTIKGRAEQLGRPALYGTTKQFLDVFGLSSLQDLPTVEEFTAGS